MLHLAPRKRFERFAMKRLIYRTCVGVRLVFLLFLLCTAKSLRGESGDISSLQGESSPNSNAAIFDTQRRSRGRRLFQLSPSPADPAPPSPSNNVQIVVESAPSTAAIVGGVVGGLAGLTLVLAVALVFAAGSINQWWCCTYLRLLGGRADGDGESMAQISSRGTGLRSARLLDVGQGASSPPSQTMTPSTSGPPTAEVWGVLSSARTPGTLESGSTQLSPSDSQAAADLWGELLRRAPEEGAASPASGAAPRQTSARAADLAWRECLIDPAKVLILRRPHSQQLWRLGGGSFGQVYKALYDDVQVVAVKVLGGMADPALLEAFLREGHILRHCRDPNIVQFVGAAYDPATDQALLVTEFMEAGDLWRALRWRDAQGHRVFGWYNRGKKAALDAARGLHYLHSHHIIHLDLKSANILLARDGTAKLADVGLAKTNLTKNYLTNVNALGTFAWCAPEVLTGQKCDEKADIFSFGVVMWEICTGEMPSRGTMRNIEAPAECPGPIRDLCDRCMSADPRQRPTAKEIVVALEAAGAGNSGLRQGRRRSDGKGGTRKARFAGRQLSISGEVEPTAWADEDVAGREPPDREASLSPWQQLQEAGGGERNASNQPPLPEGKLPSEQVAHPAEAESELEGGPLPQASAAAPPAMLSPALLHVDSLTSTSVFANHTERGWSSSSSEAGSEGGQGQRNGASTAVASERAGLS